MKGDKNMSWLEKVKKYVRKFEHSSDYDEYFIVIPVEEEDNIITWLKDYVLGREGNRLFYEFREIINTSKYEILKLSF